MNEKFVSAIIVAAGSSSRMGAGKSKMFIRLCGKEVILHTVELFSSCPLIDEIIVVCRDEDRERIELLCKDIKKPMNFAKGGETRQESVSNGIEMVDKRCMYLAIHDGARPLVTQSEVAKVILDAKKYGGATLSTKVKDTIKVSSGGFIKSTPSRENLYAVQTPQVFLKELYIKAAQKFKEENFTDDCRLLEEYGEKVYLSSGEYTNIKITTADDIILAQEILKGRGNECLE